MKGPNSQSKRLDRPLTLPVRPQQVKTDIRREKNWTSPSSRSNIEGAILLA
jgi:hypothetical protein